MVLTVALERRRQRAPRCAHGWAELLPHSRNESHKVAVTIDVLSLSVYTGTGNATFGACDALSRVRGEMFRRCARDAERGREAIDAQHGASLARPCGPSLKERAPTDSLRDARGLGFRPAHPRRRAMTQARGLLLVGHVAAKKRLAC